MSLAWKPWSIQELRSPLSCAIYINIYIFFFLHIYTLHEEYNIHTLHKEWARFRYSFFTTYYALHSGEKFVKNYTSVYIFISFVALSSTFDSDREQLRSEECKTKSYWDTQGLTGTYVTPSITAVLKLACTLELSGEFEKFLIHELSPDSLNQKSLCVGPSFQYLKKKIIYLFGCSGS